MATPRHEGFASPCVESPEAEPVTILIGEHRLTEKALNCLERMAERWSGPEPREPLDEGAIRELLTFFQTFVEAWHFRREEAYFAASGVHVESLEIHESGGCTFHEHERCSEHLRGIEAAVEIIASGAQQRPTGRAAPSSEAMAVVAAYRRFGEHARAYSDILLKHIENEEDFVYPLLHRRATPENKQSAVEAFRRTSELAGEPNRLDECLAMVESLAERFVSAGGKA